MCGRECSELLRRWKWTRLDYTDYSECFRRYIEEFSEDTGADGNTDVAGYVDQTVKNPISIFKLIQRIAYFLEDWKAEKGTPGMYKIEKLHENLLKLMKIMFIAK